MAEHRRKSNGRRLGQRRKADTRRSTGRLPDAPRIVGLALEVTVERGGSKGYPGMEWWAIVAPAGGPMKWDACGLGVTPWEAIGDAIRAYCNPRMWLALPPIEVTPRGPRVRVRVTNGLGDGPAVADPVAGKARSRWAPGAVPPTELRKVPELGGGVASPRASRQRRAR